MYPRLPWELVVEPLRSAEHTLGTTSVQCSYKIVDLGCNEYLENTSLLKHIL
jgi:hypothetical protein